ncbi:hypothetical protein LTR95_012384 [Oleoguttula sp. CCFEE 5521]
MANPCGDDLRNDSIHRSMSIMLGDDRVHDYPANKPYSVCISKLSLTAQRIPYIPKRGNPLQDPGTARVNLAVSNEAPDGTTQDYWAANHTTRTTLQQHCLYFDQDEDGVISLNDTYTAVRKWGWSMLLSLIVVVIIHGGLSYPTQRGWMPDPFFSIRIDNIHKGKHGSDSTTYDNEGRYRPQAFEDLFAKYDRGRKGALGRSDLARALKVQRLLGDVFGSIAAALEWIAVYLLIWPKDGLLRKDDVRRVFDGSIFEQKAHEYEMSRLGGEKLNTL